MLRSMYSGVSGLRNFQTKLDVIGNNIANVNTHGFKKGRVNFKDLFSQTAGGASAPVAGGIGGTNPKQIGLGSQLATIDTIFTEGSTQTTNREFDLAIVGDGFFVISDGTTNYYTRNGVFYYDLEGYVVNGDGHYLLDTGGARIQINGGAVDEISSLSVGTDGIIRYMVGNTITETNPIGVARFINNDGLRKEGQNRYQETANSGAADIKSPGEEGAGVIRSGALEMSNVDLSEEFVEMIVAQRGLQANTRIITTSDEVLQELLNLKR